jgi:hypothetical protein
MSSQGAVQISPHPTLQNYKQNPQRHVFDGYNLSNTTYLKYLYKIPNPPPKKKKTSHILIFRKLENFVQLKS